MVGRAGSATDVTPSQPSMEHEPELVLVDKASARPVPEVDDAKALV
jgi:hypothetical protein